MLSISLMCNAQFSGQGLGTENNPYLVSTAEELFEVRNDLDAYYKQVDDIDLSEWIQENNPNQGWSPIGNSSNPFKGNYDGNYKIIKGLYINRSSMETVGLFGCIAGAEIKNISLISPRIIGGECVGVIVGKINIASSDKNNSVNNNYVYCFTLSAGNYGGAVVGNMDIEKYVNSRETAKTHIFGNYVSGTISGNITGGICGRICGGTCGQYCNRPAIVEDNIANCKQTANIVGGIIGTMDNNRYYCDNGYRDIYKNECLQKNIALGVIKGKVASSGIVGSCSHDSYAISRKVQYNCSLLTEVSNEGGNAYRICNYDFSDSQNIASVSMKVISKGKEITVEDNGYNGIGYGNKTLMRQSTYEGLGFDFINQWTIQEEKTYPYNFFQSSPADVLSFYAGSKSSISGTAIGNGTAFVVINETLYETPLVDGQWSINVGNIAEGTKSYVCVKTDMPMPSIVLESISVNKQEPEPDYILGDSNSDGVVDAADVVGTINYILGKPSSSFNQQNADVNEDGQILVDDAVGTVNVIMNNQ